MIRQQRRFRIFLLAAMASVLLSSGLFVVGGEFFQNIQNASAKSGYDWKQLKIGGGGFVTGIVMHPTDPSVRYVRTDVGGAYRWDAKTQAWVQMITANGVSDGVSSDYNVESIALSQSHKKEVIVASGNDSGTVDTGQGRILRSNDGGRTWKSSAQHFWMQGNGDARQGTERLAIDPVNNKIVYFGSRAQGLWISKDEGATWTQVPLTSVPAGTSPAGVEFVRVDPTGPVVHGISTRVYASVAGQGLYRSDDAGATWRQIVNSTDLAFTSVIASDQTLYVGFVSSIRRYNPIKDSWTDISPRTGNNSWQVAVSPVDPNFLFAAPGGLSSGNLFRSTDGGVTWQGLDMTVSPENIPWVAATNEKDFFSTATLAFDPTMPTRIWLAQGTGLWHADDLQGTGVTWINGSQGIEEMVTTDLVAPAGEVPVSTFYDRQGVYHANPDTYPSHVLLDDGFWGGTSINYSGGNPNFLVTVQAKNNYYPALTGRGAYSTDGGRSWTLFPKVPAQNVGGNIAVSATDPNNIVWLPSTGDFGKGNTPAYTVDRGTIWGNSSGITSSNTHWLFWWGSKRALDADKVLGATFYVVTFDGTGTFYVSHDGGATFTQAANSPSCSQANDCHVFGQLHAAPGEAGHVWSSGGKGGLWYTTDGGATAWHQIPAVQEARSFGFGKALPGSTYPAIYLNGKANGDANYGIYRSADQGATWTLLSAAPAGIYDQVNSVNGDMNIPGRVYVGFGGNGFVYGDDQSLTKPTVKKAVKPVLECVLPNSDGKTYTAYFGTQNDNNQAVTIPVGSANKFSPDPQDRGQIVTFAPGRQQDSFSIPFDGSNLVWTLTGPDGVTRTATASSTSQACTFTPTPTPTPLPEPTITVVPPATSPLTIFDDAVGDGWYWFNYYSDASILNTSPVHSGSYSVSLTGTQGFGAVVFARWKPPIDAPAYGGISFWVNGGTTPGVRQMQVFTNTLADGSGVSSPSANFDAPADTWTLVTIPMSALGNPDTIGRIVISDRTGAVQPTLYIDDVSLSTR
ncbi:VPS10 domain-containing protein [Tengunoibacter tsumagoiensis]|uniref:Sortilin N-terminal domain-containing protein n=1 Tax=Tengunoibacter tsumagoiensis TaxID=2014871 RepID=A0A402A9U6_9CHLR|nr:hypothetical protein [Tengunoibacter tsumagoiensis]GCE15899.1 hypothetical protein KTT_57580 [Tengunoibacter tsumagoiensis]